MWVRSISLILFMVVVSILSSALAQNIIPDNRSEQDVLSKKLERGRIGIVSGGPGGTYIRLGSDISRLMERLKGDELRVIVQEGRGSVSNLRDLSFLKYVDLALVQADVLVFLRESDPQDYNYLKSKIGYVASFHPEIIHVIARGGPFKGPQDLAGKRIAIGLSGSGTQITAPNVLKKLLGIDAEFVDMHQQEALGMLLKDDSEIDALVYVAGRGSSIFTGISDELRTGIEENDIYFVPFPDAPPTDSPYIQTELSDKDYDKLIGVGETFNVWAVPAVLAAYDWKEGHDRNRRLKEFIDVFFSNKSQFDDGVGGFNDNWCSIDLSAKIGGWKRIPAVSEWLDNHSGFSGKICSGNSKRLITAEQAVKTCQPFRRYLESEGVGFSNPSISAFFKLWLKGNPSAC